MPALPPAKFVQNGTATESMIASGSILSGCSVERSVVANNVRIHSGAHVEGSVILAGTEIGRGAVVRNAILDKHVLVPDGARIGVDLDADRSRFNVTESGITVIGKGVQVEV